MALQLMMSSPLEIKGPRNTTSLSQSENFEDYEVSFKLCPLLNLEWHLTASGKSRKYILLGMKSSEIDFLHWHSHQSSISETEKSTVSKFSGTHFKLHAFNSNDTQDTEDINIVEEFNPIPISTQVFDSCFT
ncbi:uncharacterized protein [Solanum tuberosum]|uniref:uncharacterized protein isoform X2 n=1 Tax=Solanum tuberosum TaxID=4113 RepID=UPI00073A28F4|nr:PREDICTED: uncharacterized protein LOC107057706 isoform X2 [Solanum tuberosum]